MKTVFIFRNRALPLVHRGILARRLGPALAAGLGRALGPALGVTVLGAAVAALVACGGGSSGDDGSSAAGNCSVAFATTFNGFRSWSSYHYDSATSLGGATHVSGPRTEYVNQLPPAGATEFPVGTIIVKEIEATDPTNHHIFAMVKRGCDFNSAGAKGWEWFELQEPSGVETILWRGVTPPAGDTYGGDPTGGCNSCHGGGCSANDSVCSPRLVLAGGGAGSDAGGATSEGGATADAGK